MALSREQILARKGHFKTAEVELADGAVVRVRELTLKGQLDIQRAHLKVANDEPGPDPDGLALALCLVDDNGDRICTPEDSDNLREWPMSDAERILEKIGEISASNTKAVKESGKKDSENTPSGATSTSSPSDSTEPSEN